MAFSRYSGVTIFDNNADIYEEFLEERGLRRLEQFGTSKMFHPTASERANLEKVQHIWKSGDRYYKLANEYYGDSLYWWVIAQYNQKPTEADITQGDIILIPMPLQDVLSYFRL